MLEIGKHKQQLHALCRRFRVKRLELFGSAATGRDLARTSDLDFLVDLGERPPAEYAAAYFALREQLEALFARPVDLVTPPGLGNKYFRQRVEQEKTLLYAA